MQSTGVLTINSQSPKTPLANTKQMRSLQEVKVRMEKLHLSKGRGQLKKKKASLEAISLNFEEFLPLGREMPQEMTCRHVAEQGRLQSLKGSKLPRVPLSWQEGAGFFL